MFRLVTAERVAAVARPHGLKVSTWTVTNTATWLVFGGVASTHIVSNRIADLRALLS